VAADRTDDHLWLIRLDAAGAIVWERRYPNRQLGRPVGVLPDGDRIVVALENGWLLKVDETGAVDSLTEVGGMSLAGVAPLPSGEGYLAYGGTGFQQQALAELGPDGSVRWARVYPKFGDIATVAPRADGGWNVAQDAGSLFKVDATGAPIGAVQLEIDGIGLIWSVQASGGAGGEIALSIIADFENGQFATVILDRDLGIVDASQQRGVERRVAGNGHAVKRLDDGGLVFAGETGDLVSSVSNKGIILERISSDGAVAWAIEYAAGDSQVPPPERNVADVTTTSDGGNVTVGSTWSLAAARCGHEATASDALTDFTVWDLWVVKVPSTGLMTPLPDSGLTRSPIDLELIETTFEVVPASIESAPLEVTVTDGGTLESEATNATVRSQAP
jgi:hypothetical protein